MHSVTNVGGCKSNHKNLCAPGVFLLGLHGTRQPHAVVVHLRRESDMRNGQRHLHQISNNADVLAQCLQRANFSSVCRNELKDDSQVAGKVLQGLVQQGYSLLFLHVKTRPESTSPACSLSAILRSCSSCFFFFFIASRFYKHVRTREAK